MSDAPFRCIVCEAPRVPLFEAGGTSLVRCPTCGLEWQGEFPGKGELRTLYGERYLERWGADTAERLAQVRAMKEATYRVLMDEIAAHRRSGRLLDVGCALGFLLGVARARGFEAYGLDLNEPVARAARKEFGRAVHCGGLDADAFPGIDFDVITLIDVLEHVPDPGDFLDRVAARLSSSGIVAAILPNASSLTRRVLGRRWPHYAPEHLYHWSASNLPRFLERRGWRVRRLREGFRKTFTAHYLHSYTKNLGRTLVPGLGHLGALRLRIPTGEMLVIAERVPKAGS
jgi:2-polyprenyl-3-methyl-5-hydroxy-6-metoxy-1,4-benzoquinol methylase